MKVRIAFTVDVDEKFRRALAHYLNLGEGALATSYEVREFFQSYGEDNCPDVVGEYDAEMEGRPYQKTY